MPKPSPARFRRSLWLALIVGCALLVLAAGPGIWFLLRAGEDRATAVALWQTLTSPRYVHDGRALEARFDFAVEDLAAAQGRAATDVRRSLDRFASGSWIGAKRTGYDSFVAQLAARRFETAIVTARDLGNAAKSGTTDGLNAWQYFTLSGVLELGRGRAIAAEPLLQQAFDLANRADALDTPFAARLLTACGALQLARSRPADAEPYLRRAASILARTPAADLRDRSRVLTHFAQSIAAQGFPEEAEPLCAEALALAAQYRRTTGRPDSDFAVLEQNYRKILRERGLADAEIATRVRATLEPR